jgi:hypothetical protein
VLVVFGWMVIGDLIAFTDPMTNWGHTMALAIGVATWPLLRRVSSPGQLQDDDRDHGDPS